MYAASWSDSSRKSLALPIFQPFASRRFRFSARIVVLAQSLPASSNDLVRCLFRLLGENSQDQDRVAVNTVHQPPGQPLIIDPKLMAARRNRGHWTRLRHAQLLALLQTPQQKAGFDSRRLRKRWGFDLPMEPRKRFVPRAHETQYMSEMTYMQVRPESLWGPEIPVLQPRCTRSCRSRVYLRVASAPS